MKEHNSKIALVAHIEKTAGTSLRELIERTVGRNHVYLYHAKEDRLSVSSDGLHPTTNPKVDRLVKALSHPLLAPLLSELSPLLSELSRARILKRYPDFNIPDDARVILGHFSMDRFNDIVHVPIRAVIFREPLERMASHYDHWRRNRGAQNWRVRIPYRPGLLFEEFAMLSQLQNYQTQALSGLDISDFHVVGTVKEIQGFSRRLLGAFVDEDWCSPEDLENFEIKQLNVMNRKRKSPVIQPGGHFTEEFKEFHSADYSLYSQALDLK